MRKATRIVAITLALMAAACSSSNSSTTSPGGGTTKLTVFAASSLTGAFTQIGIDFEASNSGTTVDFNFGSSTDLAAQIASEGTADVFASASGKAMDAVQAKPGVTGRTDFATNQLVIVTPANDPGGVSSMQDLTKPDVKLVLAAVGVPVGDYARQALTNAGILDAATANVVSDEQDDASVLAKVASGEADAGIVYTSDVSTAASSGTHVRSVDIPAALNVTATYPIAVVTGATRSAAAQAFVAYVTGSSGQATLKTFGFGPPPAG
ncbi:MAG TPA: molybdate ABC transporter substrate-binding protein [Actinomycetota bacterium]|nr:molybdate ABC transporter substrate-binding protein [Actinomycetota bacterium]